MDSAFTDFSNRLLLWYKPAAASASWCELVCGLGMCHVEKQRLCFLLNLPLFTQSPHCHPAPPHPTAEPTLLVLCPETPLLCIFAISPFIWEAGAALLSLSLPSGRPCPPGLCQPRSLCTHPALSIQQWSQSQFPAQPNPVLIPLSAVNIQQ